MYCTYQDGEIARPMSEVPHPFISETMDLLKNIPTAQKNKVRFIHLNHTNPVLQRNSKERKELMKRGFGVGGVGERVGL